MSFAQANAAIWTAQADLQPVSFKSGRLPGEQLRGDDAR